MVERLKGFFTFVLEERGDAWMNKVWIAVLTVAIAVLKELINDD